MSMGRKGTFRGKLKTRAKLDRREGGRGVAEGGRIVIRKDVGGD